ncbi:MAG: hypothetical protein CVU78_04095 [Elusimicrobia bacterium HGW-Elusimicrobia-2]|nr:MAG: hypothetical protein CVU78_04095 [Elusimicrobia bacterium HGW-Elusimicrobia-2]
MRSNKAFTLIELMIVVTIVGLLSAVAVPKFANMMRKANEAVTKSNLGVLRSVVSIYYADHIGVWPYQDTFIADYSLISALDSGAAIVPKYVSAIPAVQTGLNLPVNTNVVVVAVQGDGSKTFEYNSRATFGSAAWVYMKDIGTWYVNCNELDTKGEGINTW